MDLLLPEDIDRMRRPRLAEMLAIARGSAYLLSSEGEEGDEHLTVLIVSAWTAGYGKLLRTHVAEEILPAYVEDKPVVVGLRHVDGRPFRSVARGNIPS